MEKYDTYICISSIIVCVEVLYTVLLSCDIKILQNNYARRILLKNRFHVFVEIN